MDVATRVAIGGQLRVKRRRSMVYVGKGRGCKPMSGGAIGREMRGARASGTVLDGEVAPCSIERKMADFGLCTGWFVKGQKIWRDDASNQG
jgi:hypothetical protein